MSIVTGSIYLYAGTTPPGGFIFCNGQSISAYPALMTVLGTTTAPNLINRFPVQTTLGTTGGSFNINSYTLPSHQHNCTNFIPGSHSHSWNVNTYVPSASNANNTDSGSGCFNHNDGATLNINFSTETVGLTGTMGSTGDINVSPINITNKYLVLNYIIKT
jgi:microcystin-dependent protein